MQGISSDVPCIFYKWYVPVSLYKLIQISDLHLSRTRAYTYANWLAVKAYIEAARPDWVINTGDLLLDHPEDVDDLIFANDEMAQLTVPYKILPGDHDIGGAPPQPALRSEVPWLERYLTTPERRERYLAIVGEDWWDVVLGSWLLIGLNASLFGSGFAAEAAQWQFLEDRLQAAGERSIALFMHKPPCLLLLDEPDESTRAIPVKARQRIHLLTRKHPIRLIASGHRHLYRTYISDGVLIVNAPPLMADLHGSWATDGLFRNGLVEYTLSDHAVEFRMIEPEGVTTLDLPAGGCFAWPQLLPSDVLKRLG